MNLFDNLATGFAVAFSLETLLLACIGCVLGTIIGALPGLGPSNGVAILIPISFTLGLDASGALALMTSVYYGAMYGGRISSILLNIPGDEPAMVTTLDGYPMAKAGRAGDALVLSGIASFVGAFLATIGLMLLSPLLSRAAYSFGPAEYFALYILAFLALAGVGSASRIKSLMAITIGLAVSTVGLDGETGVSRFTAGNMHLMDGIDFLVAIVGLFAVAEVIHYLEHRDSGSAIGTALGRLTFPGADLLRGWASMLRGSLIGFISGVLPGAGASLGSFLAYSLERSLSHDKDSFGKGNPKGVMAPEAGNNAAAGGALVPMLTLGVPGSGTTAVLLALLITLNITPGPLLFIERPDVVWGLIATCFIANFVLLLLNVPLVKVFVRVLAVPGYILMPGVTMVAFVGIYSLSGSYFELLVMIMFGVAGYAFKKIGIPLVPIILGILLGGEMEGSLRQAMVLSGGDWTYLFASGVSITLWIIAAVLFFGPFALGYVKKTPRPAPADAGKETSTHD